ncbi:hypothetical protein BDQ17DRAFT_530397 [Cyathus striatus]|nr:hypothetical protein BDQ17DRAFT_530397 [Cyathus striatus]
MAATNGHVEETRVWVITGTSSGFGRRLVTSALARGDRVIATARSQEKLDNLVSLCSPDVQDNLRTLELDINEAEDVVQKKIDEAAAIWGRIDVLVNNAGIGYPSLVEEGGNQLLRRQFETNVFGIMNVTYAALPHLRNSPRNDATVVTVGSRSAWKTELAGIGPYAASKAAIHVITETLMVELSPFNIRVLLVEPGSFRTEGIYGQGYNTSNPISAYDELRNVSIKRFASVPGTEKGDPDKAMEAVVDVVRGEGVAKGRPFPPYLVLGQDAENDIRNKCAKVLTNLDAWQDVTRGVNFS